MRKQPVFKNNNKLPLSDILVIELGGHVSGPKAGEELVIAGARVIKVEFGNGDPARNYLLPAIFTQFNASKESIKLEKTDSLYRTLLASANVIIDNRSPEAKVHDETLQEFLDSYTKKHPVIYCSIVGYDSLLYAKRRGLDVTVQAETGMMKTNGPSEEFPLKVGFVVLDSTTGIQAASSIKDAIIALQKNTAVLDEEKIIFVEVSMARMSANLQSGQYLKMLITGKEEFREGNRDQFLAPFSAYPTKDKPFVIAIVDDKQFATFCDRVLQNSDFFKKYPTNTIRIKNIKEFEKELMAMLQTKTQQEWISLCEKNNIPYGQVKTISEAKDFFGENFFFAKTKQGTTIVRGPDNNSLFSRELSDAPGLGEQTALIKKEFSPKLTSEFFKEVKATNSASTNKTLQSKL